MDMRKDAGRQMNRSGYQASGECVSGGVSVEEWGGECGIGKAGLLIGGQF